MINNKSSVRCSVDSASRGKKHGCQDFNGCCVRSCGLNCKSASGPQEKHKDTTLYRQARAGMK